MTPRDREILRTAESSADDLVKSYGGNPRPASPRNIYLLEPGAVRRITKGRGGRGLHSILGQYIAVEREPSDLAFALTLSHEFLHLKSYKSAQISTDGTIRPYRCGIQLFSRASDDHYFTNLEEAIVAESVLKLYHNTLRHHPLFQAEVDLTDRLRPWLKKLMVTKGVQIEKQAEFLRDLVVIHNAKRLLQYLESRSGNVQQAKARELRWLHRQLKKMRGKGQDPSLGRYKERRQLNGIMEGMLDKLGGRYKNRDEVFDLFARANFTGNLLPVARAVEEAFGRGSFRWIAETEF